MGSEHTGRIGVTSLQLIAAQLGLIFREQPIADYGVDGHIEVMTGSIATGRLIAVQVKTGVSYLSDEIEDGYWLPVSTRHKELWLNHSLPVIVVVCDPRSRVCYYELVTDEVCIPRGHSWKILLPKAKVIDENHLADLISIASPIAAETEFSTVSVKDYSFALARRVSLELVAHPQAKSLNKHTVTAMIRKALAEGRRSTYFRDNISRSAMKNRSVGVVSGQFYLREQDRSTGAPFCTFQWICAELSAEARPIPLLGEPDIDGLIISWLNNQALVRLMDTRRSSKDDYLSNVDRIIELLPRVEISFLRSLKGYPADQDSSSIIMYADLVDECWDDTRSAPLDCAETQSSSAGSSSAHWQLSIGLE